MGYWIALVVGVFIGFMGIMGLIAMGLDIGPGGRDVDPGPLRVVIPLVISAALISIAVIRLRKRKRERILLHAACILTDARAQRLRLACEGIPRFYC